MLQELDLIGLKCPWPIIRTKAAMQTLKSGEKLQVATTDPSFKLDLQVYLRQTGYNLVDSWQAADVTYHLLQK